MSNVLSLEHTGIPLHLIEKKDFAAWLEQQPESTQHWLIASGFKGYGSAVLPKPNGELAEALCVTESLTDYFACGQLASTLPAGTYKPINSLSTEQWTAVAFGWGVGAYRFDRYTEKKPAVAQLAIADEKAYQQAVYLVEATKKVRDLV
ncbi:MAG: leucyl aminopeptidase family protein, partial [Oleibacter sp.]|nr:leucyl aminopeptidase family protein [Thalassolituus sp.]